MSRRRVVASPFPTARKLRLPADLSRPREPSEPPRSEVARRLGEQMKGLRIAAGLSGGALSRESGVSRSMISRIERGTASPSIETLGRLARALGAPMSRLFSDQTERLDFSYVPAGGGLVVERVGVAAGYRYELVGHLLSGNLFVEPYLVQMAPQAQPYTSFQHPGVKLLYVVSGRLRYRYGTRSLVLGLGDTLMFDATALHGVEQIEEGPAAYLSIVFTVRG